MNDNVELFRRALVQSKKCRKNNEWLSPILDSLDYAINEFIEHENGLKIQYNEEIKNFGLIFGREIDAVDKDLSELIHNIQRVINGYPLWK